MTRNSAIHLGHSVAGEKPGGPAPVAATLDRREDLPTSAPCSLLVLASATHPELATNSTHRGCRATPATQARTAETPCLSRGVTLRTRLSRCASPGAQCLSGPGAQLAKELNESGAFVVSRTASNDLSTGTTKRSLPFGDRWPGMMNS